MLIITIEKKDKRDEDISDKDKNDESKTAKKFDAISKDIKNNERTTKTISAKNHGRYINLHPLIIQLINAGKQCSKKIMDFM